tara:strand:+ start:327 stop:581 length:255 start_codon:yes stop_codon:yes gene_type:complete
MDEIDPRVIQAFSFVEKNEMWDAINILLDASIDVEVTYAISGDTQGEDRTHAAGRASALTDFHALLHNLRSQAREQNGMTPVKS